MAKYTNGFRNCVVRNVFPVLMRKEFTKQRPRVNFSHFDPKILPYLKWIPNDLTINKYWIPLVVGLAIGLLRKRNFDCEALNVEHFYAVPNYDFKESLCDLRRASAQQGKPVAAGVIDGANITPRTDPLQRDVTTLAIVYGRRHGTISKYIADWMPRLENVGNMLYEIPLELNHNFFTKEYCLLHNLPYLEEGYRKDEYE
jgi:hypothetical protein